MVLTASFMSACSTSKPCEQAGDTAWVPPIRGNKRCFQKKLPNGQYVDHGKYVIWSEESKKLLLEGEFKDGRKEGTWIEYDEKGNKVRQRTFVDGAEITVALPAPKAQR